MDIPERTWSINCRGTLIKARAYKYDVKQSTPIIYFEENGKKFTVEFNNQSDYMGSRHGAEADVMVISNNRSTRFPGVISNLL